MLVNLLGLIVTPGGYFFDVGKVFYVLPGGVAVENGKLSPVVVGPVSFI